MNDFYSIACLSVPLLAIVLSFLTKKVPLSLGISILFGIGLLVFNKPDSFIEISSSLFTEVLFKSDNIKIILFTTFISLMVSLMVYNRNIDIVASYLVRFARDRKSAQLMTWFSGLIIFFDDYANTFIVGNTLKPITDRHKISREKLAYIVDSTAAPVAAIALVSTWIGNEVKEISAALGDKMVGAPYNYFLQSLKYNYYPILALAMVLITILTGREFGPMLKARPVIAHNFKHLERIKIKKRMLFMALLPMIVLLTSSITCMLISGYFNLENKNHWDLQDIIASSNTIDSLLIGSILGLISANFFFRKNLFDAIYFSILKEGTNKIIEPLIILLLAWTLGFILKSLGTSQIIIHLLPQDTSPYILPGIIFLFSCIISFATGSSFSTMGIVYPIALPIVFGVCKHAGFSLEVSNQILYHSIACVLSGAVFGDHCSPISDTTILSSIATECNHLQHVRTQLPYALIVGGISLFMSLTLANMGLHWFFVYGLGMLVLYMVVRVYGRTYR